MIVIIGILAAIVIVAYNGITNSAKDAKRAADLNSIAKALARYHIDHGGYPRCGATTATNTPPTLSSGHAVDCLEDDLVPDYMNAIPTDPVDSGAHQYHYAAGYRKTGAINYSGTPATDNYILGVKQEATTSPTYSGWGHTSDLTLLIGS